MKFYYEKQILNYDVKRGCWYEVQNLRIIELLIELRERLYTNYSGVEFNFRLKPSRWRPRLGAIKIKTTLDKLTVLRNLEEIFKGLLHIRV